MNPYEELRSIDFRQEVEYAKNNGKWVVLDTVENVVFYYGKKMSTEAWNQYQATIETNEPRFQNGIIIAPQKIGICICNLHSIMYHRNGYLDRDDGPAVIDYNSNWQAYRLQWYKAGRLHRSSGPADIQDINSNIVEKWYINGKLNRSTLPAVVYKNRDYKSREEWYSNGCLHNSNGPAVVFATGEKEYWIRGHYCTKVKFDEMVMRWIDKEGALDCRYYKIDDNKLTSRNLLGQLHHDTQPALIDSFGTQHWYQNGLLHREGGPAIDGIGIKKWYREGSLHREDGPAWIDDAAGEKRWFLHGFEFSSEASFLKDIARNRYKPFDLKLVQDKQDPSLYLGTITLSQPVEYISVSVQLDDQDKIETTEPPKAIKHHECQHCLELQEKLTKEI